MSGSAEQPCAEPDASRPGPTAEPTDAALVIRARDGDVSAFESLVVRYQGRLFRVAYLAVHNRQDAEDLVQEAFLTSWRRLEALTDPAAFRPWLFQICTRRGMDLQRRQATRHVDPVAPEDFPDPDDDRDQLARRTPDPESSTLVNTQMRRLATLLEALEPELRTCWLLREIEGLSYAEIAQVQSLTAPTVRGRLARARAAIESGMEEWR